MIESMVTIVLGLLSLSLLVTVHELGHFLMAKVASIKVLVFSIGWGKKIFSKQVGDTLWVISLLPLGGYCKMAGEETTPDRLPEPGELGYGNAWRRILTVAGGPLFSLLFALLLFMVATTMSYQTVPFDGKIVVTEASETEFQDGDVIISINNKKITYGQEWKQVVASSARQKLLFTLLRDGSVVSFDREVSMLDDGRGYLPIDYWIAPIIGGVIDESSAYQAGLLAGDRVISINDRNISHAGQIRKLINEYGREPFSLMIERSAGFMTVELSATYSSLSDSYLIGITFAEPTPITVKGVGFWQAPAEGLKELQHNTSLYMKAIKNLFYGVKLEKAISGPLQTTYILGSVAQQSIMTDGRNIVFFMAFISLILALMNLLPIPLLDGGLIVLYLLEALKGSAISPGFLKVYQFVGTAFIIIFIGIALFSDFSSFFR